jgi:hypothetical protein
MLINHERLQPTATLLRTNMVETRFTTARDCVIILSIDALVEGKEEDNI